MTPTQKTLFNFALAGAAGGLAGAFAVPSKRGFNWSGAVLGASALMVIYGLAKERVTA